MEWLKLIVKVLLISFLSISAVKAETKNECIDNADLYGYTTTIAVVCSYEINEKYSQLISEINRSCNAQYGNKLAFNASMAGIHSAKAQITENGRNNTCRSAYEEYKILFE